MERLQELITFHIGNLYCLDDLFGKSGTTNDPSQIFTGRILCPETAVIGKMVLDVSMNDTIFCFSLFMWLLLNTHRSFYVYQVILHFLIRDFKTSLRS